MKTIGLIGGMSWESTIPYYKIINEYVGKELGGLHNARIILYSVEFGELEKYMSAGEWNKIENVLSDAAVKLQNAGADVVLICTNTMHKMFPQIQDKLTVPMIHIADATGDELERHGKHKVALLGTKYTMTEDFYKSRLIKRGFEVIIPDEDDIKIVNDVIFDELCCGIVKESSREAYSRIITKLKDKGADSVILGCTEIGILIRQEDSVLPIFDTTVIHAESAARFALS
ncbi:aspartate/glutamate racemase family protein [Butyrivibrio sp. WCD3002]|uniref:aspartate/glutamate racemase family protein n=1 Tax=Butyrivibrio sp. WCD3002 TaxID=1280676 RepID=UPI0004045120|nr:aspartate/glutamate racemase family protein [Butyrivibrio sp. WCD3002]